MIFSQPLPFAEALDSAEVRSLLPTEFRTQLLRQIAPELRRRAVFSAGVENARILQEIADQTKLLLDGKTDRATARLRLREIIQRLQPEPASFDAEGGLTDLGSDRRLNLILDVQTEQARSIGQTLQSTTPEALDQYPAWELLRVRASKESRDWGARWEQAGGRLVGGRMIALKDDPVWDRLGSSALFDDALDTNYPPYAFGSGMGRAQVFRTEAIALGLIDRDTQVRPEPIEMNAELKASPSIRETWLKQALEESGAGRFDSQGVLRAA